MIKNALLRHELEKYLMRDEFVRIVHEYIVCVSQYTK